MLDLGFCHACAGAAAKGGDMVGSNMGELEMKEFYKYTVFPLFISIMCFIVGTVSAATGPHCCQGWSWAAASQHSLLFE
jgi:hypothetical protein